MMDVAPFLLGRYPVTNKEFEEFDPDHKDERDKYSNTDDQPVVSPQFPSSWHLTRERALAVQAALVQYGMRAGRSRAEGRADAEPLAPNADEAQRARNRRIEIELRLLRPDE